MQIGPICIHFLNDAKLPVAVPFLEQLLTLDGAFHTVMMLVPDEPLQAMLLREAFECLILVFGNAGLES